MELWIALLSIVISGLGLLLWHSMTYFKRYGIPHEMPWPIVGNMGPVILRKEHFVLHVMKYYKRWPEAKYIGMYDFLTPVIMIQDVELIRSISVKNFENFPDHRGFVNEDTDPLFGKSLFSLKGDKWREVRTLLSPAFTSSKMKQMFELMSTCAKDFSQYIINNAKDGKSDIDVKDAFTKYTNDVIATCAFGIKVDSMRNPENDFYVLGTSATKFTGWQNLKMFFTRFCPFLAKLLRLQIFDDKVTKFFMDIVKKTIETREKEGIVRPDMIQLMMESREKTNTAFKLDIVDMTAQAFIFFFGGFDTSSALMSFSSIALTLNPEIQDRLIDEIDSVMEQTNGNPTYEAINNMEYLEAFLYEALRYYPIAGFLDRLCVTSFELPPALPGLKPFTVKPGMNVWFPAGGIHEDPEYYKDPKNFDPDRFLGKKVTANQPTYLPFGIGPRACIGNRFALLENKLVLFHLLSKCRFEKSPKLIEPITFAKTSFSLIIEGGFWVKMVPRENLIKI